MTYEWFENRGGSLTSFGTGRQLTVTLPLGSHLITLRVTDPQGAADTAEAGVSVLDTIPPTLTLSADRLALWPPNHRMVPVHVVWHAQGRMLHCRRT